MNYKIIILLIFLLVELYSLFLDTVSLRQNKIPENVSDIYDSESYEKWKKYKKEKIFLSMIRGVVEYAIIFSFFVFDVFASISNSVGGNIYVGALALLGLYFFCDLVLGFIYGYMDDMIIEQKYGFNKMSLKVFITDRIKSFIISTLLLTGIVMLFIWLYTALGNYVILVFSAVLVLFLLLVIFLAPIFSKAFNKFEPLEDGELKEKLTALLNKYGYKVKAIEVMKASEKTTKSNAYFTGFGKLKTIVLYDNLIASMTADELCAIFAHELCHGLNKDTLKTNITSILTVALIVVAMFFFVKADIIYAQFGFESLNYGFAFMLLSYVAMPFIGTVMGLITNAVSRRAEYKADAHAVKEGYGRELISSLKKLTKDNFGDVAPSKIIVALNYSHPTLSQRIEAIEKEMNKNN